MKDVIARYGVKGTTTRSTNVQDVYSTLELNRPGNLLSCILLIFVLTFDNSFFSLFRASLIKEVQKTFQLNRITIDKRHIGLLSNVMTRKNLRSGGHTK